MKKTLVLILVAALIFVVVANIKTHTSSASTKRRLESAIETYPSYMNAVYKDGENAAFCSGRRCEPRMEIEIGNANLSKAEQDLGVQVEKQGYTKGSSGYYETSDTNKLCQKISFAPDEFTKSKLTLTCY